MGQVLYTTTRPISKQGQKTRKYGLGTKPKINASSFKRKQPSRAHNVELGSLVEKGHQVLLQETLMHDAARPGEKNYDQAFKSIQLRGGGELSDKSHVDWVESFESHKYEGPDFVPVSLGLNHKSHNLCAKQEEGNKQHGELYEDKGDIMQNEEQIMDLSDNDQ